MISSLAITLAATQPMQADSIRLTSEDRSLELLGDLISFDNGTYKIKTTLGELLVDGSKVNCEGPGCPAFDDETTFDFKLAGSATVGADLMPLLIAGYAESLGSVIEQSPGAEDRQTEFEAIGEDGNGDKIFDAELTLRGSSGGFKALIGGDAEISMASRAVRAKEVEAAQEAGLGRLDTFEQEHSVGVDGLLIVVNHNNPINELSEDQVAQVLSGQITNWSQLGGADLPIKVFSRRLESSNHGTIEDRFLKPRDFEMSPESTVLSSNQVMADTVLSEPGAIGYLAFAYKQDTKPLGLIASCGITALPDGFSAKTGEYPLQRTLFLYSKADGLSQHAQDLISFATSSSADALVRKSGFLDYGVSSRPLRDLADSVQAAIEATNRPSEKNLLREMFVDTSQHERLSTTFRFRTGSSQLDNASQRDLRRLAAHLEDLPDGADIIFAGFTDTDGSFEANRALSVQRASEVQATLTRLVGATALSKHRLILKGFGELNPVGCNDDFRGKRLNRRVEIWVRSES